MYTIQTRLVVVLTFLTLPVLVEGCYTKPSKMVISIRHGDQQMDK